ncbi:MAG: G5 domain-containing protein [Armatimonadia bacterium]
MHDPQLLERKLYRAQGLVRLYRWCLITALLVIGMLTMLLFFAKAPQLGRAILINDQVAAMVRSEKAAMAVRERLLAQANDGGPGQATFREKWEDVTRPVENGRLLSVGEAVEVLKPKVTVVKEACSIENAGVQLVIVPTKETALNVLDRLKLRYRAPTDAVVTATRLRPEPTIRPCTAVPSQILTDEAEAAARLNSARTQPEIHQVREGEYPDKIAAQHGLTLSEFRQLNPELEGKDLRVGQKVNVLFRTPGLVVVTVKQCVTTEQVPPPVKRSASKTLPKGAKKTVSPGKPGRKRVRWEITMYNDREARRRSLSEETVAEAEPQEILIGSGGDTP